MVQNPGIQMTITSRQRPQKPYKFLKCVIMQFYDNCQILSFGHHLKEVEMKIPHACPFLRVSQKSEKILRVYIVLGDAVSTLQTFVWILNHVSGSITWSLFILKVSNLIKWQLWMWSFTWWLKFETRPSSLCNSVMANITQWSNPTGNSEHEKNVEKKSHRRVFLSFSSIFKCPEWLITI